MRSFLAQTWLAVIVVAACSKGTPAPIGDVPSHAAACPTHLDLELIGADSRFDPGWTGGSHGVGLPIGSDTTVELFDCDAECRRCKFRGPVRDPSGLDPVISQRCLGDLSQVCTSDADCGRPNDCRMVFPPVASQLSSAQTCALVYFEPIAGDDPSPMQGVFDFQTAELDMTVLNIYINVSIGACARCTGAQETPLDGMANGTCDNAPETACDINGIGTTSPGSTSFDCPRSQALFTIELPGDGASTATRVWTMDATRPKCTTENKPCWCGMCRDGTSCTANRDCPDNQCNAIEGPPMQGSALTPYNIDNNSCAGAATCNWDPVTRRGRCSDAMAAPCYPDSGQLTAAGRAEVRDGYYISQIANLVCMPAFGGLPDLVGGFPGPFAYEAAFRITPRTFP